MAWIRTWRIGQSLVLVAAASGCGDDERGDTAADTGATSSQSTTMSASSTDDGASMTSGVSLSGGDSQSGSGSQTASGSGADASGSATSGSGDDADSGVTGSPVACGDLTCGADEVCVQPCCGGPAPFCGPVDGEACPAGSHEVELCTFGVDCGPDQVCCEDDACVPDPPACVSVDEIVCERSPNSPTAYCNTPCFGTLAEGTIACECA